MTPRCGQCRFEMTLITMRAKDGEFGRRWKCARCGATANAGMVQSDARYEMNGSKLDWK